MIITAGLLALAVQRARLIAQRRVQAEQERELISRTFGRYLPPAVAKALIADKGALEPVSRPATVLFVDIAGFTTISESLRPHQIVHMMNVYFAAAGEAITRHEGVITQFLGDAILATFNVPVADPQHARHAVAAGLALIDNINGKVFAGQQLHLRVGIATGELTAGSVGSEGRQTYTVYGDTVNLAARLEALNKEYGTQILLTEQTAQAAGDEFEFTVLDTVTVRGKTRAIKLLTIRNKSR